MIFPVFFQKLKDKRIKIELKNGMIIFGILISADLFLNFKLSHIEIQDIEEYPEFENIPLISMRGSSVKLIKAEKDDDLIDSLLESTRNRFIVNEKREKEESESQNVE